MVSIPVRCYLLHILFRLLDKPCLQLLNVFIASGAAVVISSAHVIPHASMVWSRGASPGVSLFWWASSGSDRGVRHFRLCIEGKLWSHIDLFPKKTMMVCCGAAVDFTTRWGLVPSSLTRLSGGLPSSGHSLCTTTLFFWKKSV